MSSRTDSTPPGPIDSFGFAFFMTTFGDRVDDDIDVDSSIRRNPRLRLAPATSEFEADIAEWGIGNLEASTPIEHTRDLFAPDARRTLSAMALGRALIVVLDSEVRPEELLLMLGLRRRRTPRPSISHPERRSLYIESIPSPTRRRWSAIFLTSVSSACSVCKHAVRSLQNSWRSFKRPTCNLREFEFWIVATIHCIYMLLLLFIPRNYAARARYLINSDDRSIRGGNPAAPIRSSPDSINDDRRSGHVEIEMEGISRGFQAESDSSEHQTLVSESALVQNKWDLFLSRLFLEWKLVQYGSGLLIPAVLTIFQIPGAGDEPTTRLLGILSLICSVTSLTYTCIFVVRVHQLRRSAAASDWMKDNGADTTVFNWWDSSVFLSTPVVWISWSSIFFILTLLCIIWLKPPETSPDSEMPTPLMNYNASIAMTSVLALGLFHFYQIMRTFSKYTSSK